MSKYSSYKEHQLITENWRRFLAEAEEEVVEETAEDEVLEEDEEGLEEGWDDIKAGASKAWKKVKGGAEDAWDTVATTASDIKHSPTDLGAKYRRKRKSAADEKRQKYADEDAKRATTRAGQEKSRTQDRESRRRETEFKEKHGMSSAEYERQQGVAAKASNRDWLKKGPSAKEKADRQRRKDKDDAGLKNPEHMKTQKSNVAYAGSGGVGKSGKRFEE
jgi:flagellar biosynthesis GTPase FlhF